MADKDDIGDYLSMGDSPAEDAIHQNLTKRGTSLVNAIVQSTLSKLRSYRSGLEHEMARQFAISGVKQALTWV